MAVAESLDDVISRFGASTSKKLGAITILGEPEDQLRNPLETLLADLTTLVGYDRDKLTVVGETTISDLRTRPDFAVLYDGLLIGFIEVKAPGKGANPKKFGTQHDKDQWKKLSSLPNLMYTDGNSFSLWRDGELVGGIVAVDGDVETSGAALSAPTGFLEPFREFFGWHPIPPRNPRQMAEMSARLCRLLRDEVTEQLGLGNPALTGLADDWRHLLFPEATDQQFADGYAQTITFGLLLARARNIELDRGLDRAAKDLGTSSLMGAAMRIMTDSAVKEAALTTSVSTLTRVLNVVDWHKISKGNPHAWLYFYEDFLAEYDNKLRKQTGSYYTPVQVVESMTRLVDEALRDRFGLDAGLADNVVKIVDPGVGTGTFLLAVLARIAATVTDDLGPGAVPGALSDALSRIIGFELQLGPFAVAQLRLLAELTTAGVDPLPKDGLRLYVTDTLGNPYVEDESLGSWYEPIAQSRRAANKVKKDEPVMVVIGNPPYREKSGGKGGWVESGNVDASQPAPFADFLPRKEWGVGEHSRHLYNLYVYFWRWATWKVFDHHPNDNHGIVNFITASGFIGGAGFQGMRDYLRRRADAIYVIDCTPEGHQPPVNTRVFQGVQQPICITIAVRDGTTDSETPATVRYRRLTSGDRNAKFAELDTISLGDDGWVDCPTDWRAPFLPAAADAWSSFCAIGDLFGYAGTGIMAGRAWVIAPDAGTLQQRWDTLIDASAEDKPELLQEHKRDRRVDTVVTDNLPGYPTTATTIADEHGPCPTPVRIGFRSLDRHWIIPDKRLINQPNPSLWQVRSDHQVYLTSSHDKTPSNGPAVTFTALIPDAHHYHGRGGQAVPLWRDADGDVSNVNPGLVEHLSTVYDQPVQAPDVMAYVAAAVSHPAYTSRFQADLQTPGVRVPLTTDPQLFVEAVGIGRRIVWLHTYGQRFADPDADRPKKAPRLAGGQAPKVTTAIPISGSDMPDTITYDAAAHELHVGDGIISNVTLAMWDYRVSDPNRTVLNKWFAYRRRTREHPIIGDRQQSPLQDLYEPRWLAEYTQDLIDLLNVIGLLIDLEPVQAELLERIVTAEKITPADLTDAAVLPVPVEMRGRLHTSTRRSSQTGFDFE